MGLVAKSVSQDSKNLLFLKKKKQKDFAHWGSGCAGGDVA